MSPFPTTTVAAPRRKSCPMPSPAPTIACAPSAGRSKSAPRSPPPSPRRINREPDLSTRCNKRLTVAPGEAVGLGVLRAVELVTQAAVGDDPRRGRGVAFNLRSQALDVHIQGLGVADVVAAPHSI